LRRQKRFSLWKSVGKSGFANAFSWSRLLYENDRDTPRNLFLPKFLSIIHYGAEEQYRYKMFNTWMEVELMNDELDETRKEQLIGILTNELKVLRAKAEISQRELAKRMGVSRQTYGLIETKKQPMTWNHFMALLLLFKSNAGTADIIDRIGAYPPELERYIKLNNHGEEGGAKI
jgi:DNA-binding XRE family transcriptional regulator